MFYNIYGDIMNVVLKGVADEILEKMIDKGYATTKSEAIRLALITFDKDNLNEVEMVNKKLDRIDYEIKIGKRRLLNDKEAFGEYAKYIKAKNVKKWFVVYI